MKNLKFLYTLLLFVSVFGFVACGDDDEKDAITPPNNAPTIEGIWRLDIIEEECDTYTVFDKGMAIMFAIGDKEYEYVEYVEYTYDEKKQSLIYYYDDGPYKVNVLSLTSNKLTTVDGDGEYAIWARYDGSIKDLEKQYGIVDKH